MADAFSLNLVLGTDTPTTTVAVSGDVDALNAPTLAGLLHVLVGEGRHAIVVDLARCGLVDAAGAAMFADVARRAITLDGTVTIKSASSNVRRVLDNAGVSELVVLVDSSHSELAPIGPSDSAGERATALPIEDSAPAPTSKGLAHSTTDVVDAALRLVTALTEATITNADGVSVTLERHGRLMTVGASNDKVLTMDHHQYESGEGPCLEARAQDRWFYIESLDGETRWPTFVPLALDQGIHSILASPLKTSGGAQGSLNIYSARERAFGQREQELAALFADQASKILTAAPEPTDSYADQRFAAALASRKAVHQAQGVLMARDGVAGDDAMGSLVRSARAANMTVAAYASRLIASLRPDAGTS